MARKNTQFGRTVSALSMTTALAILAVPALAQQAGQGGNQTLTQEAAAGQGAQVYLSPADVRQIKQALNKAGYEAGDVNGQLGDNGRTALCNFQQAQELSRQGT